MSVKLPRIEPRKSINPDDLSEHQKILQENTGKQRYISPFRLPNDDEVFVYRDIERKKRDELKHMSRDVKIWDKQTGTSKRPLRLFKDFENKENVKAGSGVASAGIPGFSAKEKALITEAQRIINERRKSRDINGKEEKEGVVELLDRKKEMFLVEMTVGMIEQEREALIHKAVEKEGALKKSDEMLEKDWKDFDTYKQNNKQETDLAVQKHNQETEGRKKAELEYKIKNNELTSLKADRLKNEELAQRYIDAKKFLNKLTPKEVLEERERYLSEKIEEFRTLWMEKETLNREDSMSVLSESVFRGGNNKERRLPGLARKFTKPELEREFQEKLEKGEFDEIEDIRWNQEIYFDDPAQLMEVFTRYEERNLALIQMMQDTEQNLDTLKHSLKLKKAEFDKKIIGLRDNKALLEKNKAEKEEKIRVLLAKSKEPILAKKQDGLIPLRKKISEIVNRFKEESKVNTDQEALSTIDHLALIELCLESQLEKLNQTNPARVVELKKKCEDERKKLNRKLQMEKEQQIAVEKSKKASERAMEKSKKRGGRFDMAKSIPIEKKEVVTQVVKTNDEEEDMKYFKPYLNKF